MIKRLSCGTAPAPAANLFFSGMVTVMLEEFVGNEMPIHCMEGPISRLLQGAGGPITVVTIHHSNASTTSLSTSFIEPVPRNKGSST
eukprot:5082538-Amphidinium_carterae.2